MPTGNRPATASGRLAKRVSHERRLFNELTRLARFIDAAKRDIAAMHPDEIRKTHLPAATDELDAIVAATAEATGAILDSAEKLTALGAGADPELRDQIAEQATRIFEACSFQDITGQRITKVVKTLKQIEAKVGELVQAFGDEPAPVRGAKSTGNDEAALLNGPQLPQNAVSQSDIDALFEKE